MPPEIEEVVVGAGARKVEDLREDAADDLLLRGTGRHVPRLGDPVGLYERRPIDLAVPETWGEIRPQDDGRGDHELRQPLREVVADLAGLDARPRPRDTYARGASLRGDRARRRRPARRRMPQDRRLDLPGLHA